MSIIEYDKVRPAILGQSQKGQDSIIAHTFMSIGTTNQYYVEFGAADGIMSCNTWALRNIYGWDGLLLDHGYSNPEINLHQRRLNRDNVNSTFAEFNVPDVFDFLCVDIDGFDYWILKEILKDYAPRAIMVEVNVRFDPTESMVLKYDENWNWSDGAWYGASPYAMMKMLNSYDYVPVWITLDDMVAIDRGVLSQAGYSAPDWEYVYPAPRRSLYDSHTDSSGKITEMDSSMWMEV